VIRTLQERNLIDVVGRSEGIGRPLLYGTTRHFLEHFGFRSLEELPRPEELPIVLRERIPLGVEGEDGDDAPIDPTQVSLALGAAVRNELDDDTLGATSGPTHGGEPELEEDLEEDFEEDFADDLQEDEESLR
jgi:hypothetical protein